MYIKHFFSQINLNFFLHVLQLIFFSYFFHSDRANTGVIFETCESSDGPVIFTGHSRNIWVDFVANRNASGRGFQLSFLTIEGKVLEKEIVHRNKASFGL